MTDIKIDTGISLNINNKRYQKVKINVNTRPKKQVFKKLVDKSLEEYKEQVTNVINKVGGKFIKFDDIEHTEGIMVAGIIDDSEVENISNKEKVCFAVMNKDKKIVYINNNEHFSILPNIPASLYVLNYLNMNEPDLLYALAENAFDKDKVKVFTKICIHNFKKRTNKKQNKNNK